MENIVIPLKYSEWARIALALRGYSRYLTELDNTYGADIALWSGSADDIADRITEELKEWRNNNPTSIVE